MYKNTFFIFSIIFFFSCDGKSQAEHFPEYEFRKLENLVSKEIIFSPFSIKIPKGFDNFNKKNLDLLKNQIENDPDSYFSKEFIHGFSDSLNTAFVISLVKDKNLLKRLDKDYKNYLNETNEDVVKNQYSVNDIKAVQYQAKNNLDNIGFTTLKIFLINGDSRNYLLDFIILDRNFSKKINSIESSLSTLKRRR
tara:strand:- start:454 stop:1035 length:582 start_codon:yes stop_codon:yes gene_type:complete